MTAALRIRAVVAAASVAVIASGATPSPRQRLEVVGPHGLVWAAPIMSGERFDLAYRHSHERVIWTHHYRAGDDGVVWQDGSTFAGYGAGMPMSAVHRGADGFRNAEVRRLAIIPLISWRGAELRLLYRGEIVALDRWFDDYAPFDIRVR